jgi:hypothetical protein
MIKFCRTITGRNGSSSAANNHSNETSTGKIHKNCFERYFHRGRCAEEREVISTGIHTRARRRNNKIHTNTHIPEHTNTHTKTNTYTFHGQ